MVVMVFKNIYLNNSEQNIYKIYFQKTNIPRLKTKSKVLQKKTFSINLQGKVAFII